MCSELNNIQTELEKLGISCSLEKEIENHQGKTFVFIKNYSPDDSKRPISIAFKVSKDEENLSFETGCWTTEQRLKRIENGIIGHGPSTAFTSFKHEGKQFYGFSANLKNEYKFKAVQAESIKDICSKIYEQVRQIDQIKKDLLRLGILSSLENIRNVEDVSIIIKNYSPDVSKRPVSIAFSINDDNNNSSFNPKCWITERNLKEVGGRIIPYHEIYKEFEYENKKFYPFSVNLENYKVNAKEIKKLCGQLYKHVRFSDLSSLMKYKPKDSRFKSTDDVDAFINELRG